MPLLELPQRSAEEFGGYNKGPILTGWEPRSVIFMKITWKVPLALRQGSIAPCKTCHCNLFIQDGLRMLSSLEE